MSPRSQIDGIIHFSKRQTIFLDKFKKYYYTWALKSRDVDQTKVSARTSSSPVALPNAVAGSEAAAHDPA